MKTLVKFTAYAGKQEVPLDVKSWEEASEALKEKGFKKGDKVRVHKEEYHLVAVIPHFVEP